MSDVSYFFLKTDFLGIRFRIDNNIMLISDDPRKLVNAKNIRADLRLLECTEDLLQTILKDG